MTNAPTHRPGIFRTLTLLTLTAGLAVGGIALAKPAIDAIGPKAALIKVVKDLDLSDDQKEALQEFRDESKDLRAEGETFRDGAFEVVVAELGSEQPDRQALHGLVDEAADRFIDRAHERIDAFLDIYGTFSPDQKQVVVDAIVEGRTERANWHAEMKERFHPELDELDL